MPPYLEVFVVVLLINLMPAFGPPTWAILVFYLLTHNLNPAPLVATGAAAAALGRLGLAVIFARIGDYLPKRTQSNLAAARLAIAGHARSRRLALGLFALSPLPSAQLFEAAGLARLPLIPFTAAFFAGRLVSYSLYVSTAHVLEQRGLSDSFLDSLRSPWGVAVQLLMLVGLGLFTQLDWHRIRTWRFWPGNHNES